MSAWHASVPIVPVLRNDHCPNTHSVFRYRIQLPGQYSHFLRDAALNSLIALETASGRPIWRILDAEIHHREAGPASVRNQQLAGRQKDGRVNGRRRRRGGGVHDVRTRDAEHSGAMRHRHAEHAAGNGSVQQQEVGAAVHRETRHRCHVVVVLDDETTVCNRQLMTCLIPVGTPMSNTVYIRG